MLVRWIGALGVLRWVPRLGTWRLISARGKRWNLSARMVVQEITPIAASLQTWDLAQDAEGVASGE